MVWKILSFLLEPKVFNSDNMMGHMKLRSDPLQCLQIFFKSLELERFITGINNNLFNRNFYETIKFQICTAGLFSFRNCSTLRKRLFSFFYLILF